MSTKKTAPAKPPKKKKLPTLYKVLAAEGLSPHCKFPWPLPDPDGTPGAWVEVQGKLVQCRNGLHLTPNPEHHYTQGNRLFEAEYDPEGMLTPEGDYEVVVRRARLIRRIPWAEMEKRWGFTPDGRERRGARSYRDPFRAPPPAPEPPSTAPKDRQDQSPALRLISFVADEAERTGLSDRRTRWALCEAVETAIKTHLDFAADDITTIQKKWGRYARVDEWVYEMAVKAKHETACRAYETFAGRKPILHGGKRLCLGANVQWAGRCYTVGNINDEKGALTLYDREYVKRRYGYVDRIVSQKKVHIADLTKIEADNRAFAKRTKRIKELTEKLHGYVTMPTKFKVGSWESYDRIFASISEAQVFALPDAQVAEIAEWVSECIAIRQDYSRRDPNPSLPPPPACVATLIAEAERERARYEIAKVKYKQNGERGWESQYVVNDAEIEAFLAGRSWERVLLPKERAYVPEEKRWAKDPRMTALIPLLDGLKDPAWRPNVEQVVRQYGYKLDSLDRERREARAKRRKEHVRAEPVFCKPSDDAARSCT